MRKSILIVCILMLLFPCNTLAQNQLEITFLDVGKADAIVLQSEEKTVLIDTGKNKAGNLILSYLENHQITKIDLMIITHFDKDHVGGADRVLYGIDVDQVFIPDYFSDSNQFVEFMAAVEDTQTPCTKIKENITFDLGEMVFSIDVANQTYYGEDEENDFSLVTGVNFQNTNILFAGDAENPRLKELLQEQIGEFDVLKVPHHGVKEKKSGDFFRMIHPGIAIITSDAENPEDSEIVDMLKDMDTEVFLTRLGTVSLISDGNHWTAHQEGTNSD